MRQTPQQRKQVKTGNRWENQVCKLGPDSLSKHSLEVKGELRDKKDGDRNRDGHFWGQLHRKEKEEESSAKMASIPGKDS